VVVCTWADAVPAVPLVELDAASWRRQVEWPTALWFVTLVAAAGRCGDGGSLVAVVDRPAALDAVGQAPAVTVAEGVVNLVRSLAAREGKRGVRVNAVVSSLHTDTSGLLGSPPPLATFPGRIDVEVAGAVRMLLSDDAAGITGNAVPATAGRW
jgi:NAD(P)-dependent dehydrogenase (short-subunit alcohol dehydrogenase family)